MKLRLLVLAAFAVFLPAPSNATAADTFTIWVSPTGSDSATGTSRGDPVRTLVGAQRILCPASPCTGLGRPVEIRIEPGVYTPPMIAWRYFDDVYPTRFMPADYHLGDNWTQVSATGGRPVFDGRDIEQRGIIFTQPRPSTTGRTNLEFYYLEWRHYTREAILIIGDEVNRAEGNMFVGNYFHRIGNNWNPAQPQGWAGLRFDGSDKNTIRANHFVEILNGPTSDRGHEHGIYFVNSRFNIVAGNRFEIIGGEPVRVSDRSSGNLISGNVFKKAGGMAYIGDWHCRPSLVSAGLCSPVEYRSWGNVAKGNTFLGLYPQGLTGRSTTYCHDLHSRCPSDRIAVS